MSTLLSGHVEFTGWLKNELVRRVQANSKYSLRAMARDISLEPSSLSKILAGKRAVSNDMMIKIFDRLNAPQDLRKQCLQKYTLAKRRKALSSQIVTDDYDYLKVSEDTFQVIKDWYHFAILELTYILELKNDPGFISRKLGISKSEARDAIDRLLRLKLLAENNGVLSKTAASITNGIAGDTSDVLREFQKQVLNKALESIEKTPIELKDITSITIPVDTTKIQKARELIRNFRRDMCAFLEDGKPDEVYNLAIQLYPLSKRGVE